MALQRAEVHQTLNRILEEESRLLVELEALLAQETAILRQDDVAEITAIGSTRQRCVDALMRLDNERLDTCRMLSFGQGRGAVARLYGWSDPSGGLNSMWLANLAIARRCKKLNDSNGAIVSAKLSRVQKLLMVLRGTSPPPVYNSRGSRYGSLGARDFGRA
jgi:flagellar biosynthesis/type III secretory pathway chaperone